MGYSFRRFRELLKRNGRVSDEHQRYRRRSCTFNYRIKL